MKLNKAKLKKEFESVQKLLKKQQQERSKILAKCPELKKGWNYCWDWDKDTFFEDCNVKLEYLIHEFENHDIDIK